MYLNIHTDGGSRGNPGPAAAGVVIRDKQGNILFSRGYFLGRATNNVAEYEGVLLALAEADRLGGTELDIFCDSELLVKQINGIYRVKNAGLKPLHKQIMQRLANFDHTTVQHVYREDNTDADALVNAALDIEADVNSISNTTKRSRTNPIVGKFIELDAKIQFQEDQPHHENLNESGSLPTKLICLKTGQSCTINSHTADVTILSLQGSGTITINGKTHDLRPRVWLSAQQADAFTFQAANSTENLVVLLTRRG